MRFYFDEHHPSIIRENAVMVHDVIEMSSDQIEKLFDWVSCLSMFVPWIAPYVYEGVGVLNMWVLQTSLKRDESRTVYSHDYASGLTIRDIISLVDAQVLIDIQDGKRLHSNISEIERMDARFLPWLKNNQISLKDLGMRRSFQTL